MRPRISAARFLISFGEFIKSLAVVVMKPADLVEFGRRSYASPGSIAAFSLEELVNSGLSGDEKELLDKIPVKTGRALILGVGSGSFTIRSDGFFRPCTSLYHPDCVYDWRQGNLADAWNNFIPKILQRRTGERQILENCKICKIVNLCMWCPAHAFLETGKIDEPVDYFCRVAHVRADAPEQALTPEARDLRSF